MFSLNIPPDIEHKLRVADAHSPSISENLIQLQNNPLAKAIKLNIPKYGEYYINSGRHCIIFSVNTKQQTVDILDVVRDAYLHKILVGWISPINLIIPQQIH